MKRKIRVLALVLAISAAVFGLSGCSILVGKDGDVYGSYDWYGYQLQTYYWSSSGFPSSSTYNVYYKITPGSYYFYYRIYDGTYYYPSSSYTYVSYTVTANKGALLKDGTDKYFDIYLGLSSAYASGLSIKGMGTPVIQNDGTQVYSNEAYTISLTTKNVDSIPADAPLTTFTK